MTKIEISNRQVEKIINRGRQQILVPWPTDRLGVYGSGMIDGSRVTPHATDMAMDRYVAELFEPNRHVCCIGVCAGRTAKLEPVIVTTWDNRYIVEMGVYA